ncbi:MAG TPA: RcnB family protein [Steroidobacteraceae bacterium]|jgi:Ni/Co efflux regulator RcnB|nr:RcnB family protein [Steroidobacteraceae bacterium]
MKSTSGMQCLLGTVAMVLAVSGAALADPQHEEHGGGDHGRPAEHAAPPHAAPPRGEAHQGPHGYSRVSEPHGWNARPATVDRGAYRHNFQAARSYRIGPYRGPRGWTPRHWVYGEVLPPAYWAAQYVIGDYWLFSLEVPPVGYEWVRDGNDALLVDTQSGEILQVEYGVFT